MVSVANQMSYTSSLNAFVYRDRRVGATRQCSCTLPAEAPEKQAKAAPRSSILQLPSPVADDATDAGDSAADADSAATATEPPVRDIDPNRRVRIVGPTFMPDQSKAIDLRAPAPNARP